MGQEIAFENGRIPEFQGLVTLTLTLDRVILHTIMRHSSTSTYIQISLKSKKRFADRRTDGRADGHIRPALLGLLGGVDLIYYYILYLQNNVSVRYDVIACFSSGPQGFRVRIPQVPLNFYFTFCIFYK